MQKSRGQQTGKQMSHRITIPKMRRDKMLLIGKSGTGKWIWSCSCHFGPGCWYENEALARAAFRKHRAWNCPLTGDKK